jgi:hypothetical protein
LPQGGGGISLAALPGSTPVAKPKPRAGQQGSGAYRDFVRANLGKHKGDMKAVAAAYRAQKGGHFYNVKGEATSLKGKHNHVHGTNPKKVRKMPPGLAGSGVGSSRFTVGERQERPIGPLQPGYLKGPRQATAFALGDQARTGGDSVVRQQLSSDLVEAILKKVPPPKAHPAFASLSDRDFGQRKTTRFDVPNPVTDALVHRAQAKGLHPSDPLNYYPKKHRGNLTDAQIRDSYQYVDDLYDESLPDEKRLLQGARARVLDETPEHTELVAGVEDQLARAQTGAGPGVEQYMYGAQKGSGRLPQRTEQDTDETLANRISASGEAKRGRRDGESARQYIRNMTRYALNLHMFPGDPDDKPDEPPPPPPPPPPAAGQAAQAGAGHCQCKGPGVEQYMEGGHWWNDAWSSVKHAASTVGHDVSKAYHAVQNNPTVREVEKGVANFGVNTLARAGEGLVDAAADTASFVIGQPELAAAADMGVHELANLAQSGVKKGVDSLIDHTAQSGNGLMLPMPF